MNRNQFMTMVCAFWSVSFHSSLCLAQYHCEQQLDARNSIICAPPLGSMVKNRNGKYVCGPGQCIMLSSTDEIICSSVPGGLVALDSRNRGLCVEGCVSATEALCVSPIPDSK
jgi:hypothetical protein